MLFDLRSPGRRRVVKVVYGGLAVLFAVGLSSSGSAASASGGLSEIFGGGAASGDTGFEDADRGRREDARGRTRNDTAALAELVQLHYQAGQPAGRGRRGDPADGPHRRGRGGVQRRRPTPGTATSRPSQGQDRHRRRRSPPSRTSRALASGQLTKAATEQRPARPSTTPTTRSRTGRRRPRPSGCSPSRSGDAEAYGGSPSYFYFAGEFDKGDEAAAAGARRARRATRPKQIEQGSSTRPSSRAGRSTTAIEKYPQADREGQQAPGGAGGATGENPLSEHRRRRPQRRRRASARPVAPARSYTSPPRRSRASQGR